ncbi:hypothetical protein DH2020_025609 [Rehmannia glutinosa]|uniref:Uncharacterized protein n=1 Tax=Rehmannia glutinosa TaxID=99300 RepID=A0ABR0W1X6_REHGL
MAVAGNKELKWKADYLTVSSKPRSNIFCEFHNDYGKTTEDFWHSKDEIEWMVKKGWMSGSVRLDQVRAGNANAHKNHLPRVHGKRKGNTGAGKEILPPMVTIHMIVGGPTDGDSNRAWKAHAILEVRPIMEVGEDAGPIISFGAEDKKGVKPVDTALFVFGGGVVEPIGASINTFKAIASTFHMKLKFVMEDGVGDVLGDQHVASKCYVETMRKREHKKSKWKEVDSERETNPHKIVKRKEKEKNRGMLSVRPREEAMIIELVLGDPIKTTMIGTQLGPELAIEIVEFLRKKHGCVCVEFRRFGRSRSRACNSPPQCRFREKTSQAEKVPFGWDMDKDYSGGSK